MHSFHFDDQYNTFHSYGYAVAPGSQAVVGDEKAVVEKRGTLLPFLPKQDLAAFWSSTWVLNGPLFS